jgi:hypothetical protein
MPESWKLCRGVGSLLALACILASPAVYAATTQSKIVCWKDAAGKVIGCGDKVPPEYQDSGTRELDRRGVTRGTTESVEETNKRRLKEQEAARLKAEVERKSVEQKRQDTALMESYSNEKEIDLKRDRDLQVVDLQIEQITMSLKNASQRYSDAKTRADAMEKAGKPVSAQLKDELARAASDTERLEKNIRAKNQEKDDLRARYAEQRRRYIELRSNQGSAATASASPAPNPKK